MSTRLSQRTRRVAVLAVAGALVVAACSSSSSNKGSSATTTKPAAPLRVAFLGDMGTPDPDIFYATEGLMVTTSAYEGLLQYADNSTKIIPSLAQLPTVSADGLTYTFKLQSGVTFHDGTPFNSAAVKASFDRRTAVNQGPAYMLAHVTSVDTSDPLTAVVHLNQPVSAFLDYLAAPFGPKMMSPTALTTHAVTGDHGQQWLQTHDAGSGPYEISSFVPNQHYVLTRFSGYWGPAPKIGEVDISIVPDITTQRLQLEQGDLDMITHGLQPADVTSLSKTSGLTVSNFPAELKGILFVNPHSGAFATQAARDALEQALDKTAITNAVYGSAGAPSTQIYPAGELPDSATTSKVTHDPNVLKALVPSLSTKKVNVGFDPTDPRNETLAENVQVALQAAGLNAITTAVPISQIFDLPKHLDQAPDIVIQTTNPDAAHPDTWARIYMSAGGGANYLQCVDPNVDKLLDQGLAATTPDAVAKGYGDAGNLLVKGGCFIDIADVQDTIITRGLSGFYHVPSIPWTLKISSLTRG
jgi:peptide/nickel transport system substrate-binding protein